MRLRFDRLIYYSIVVLFLRTDLRHRMKAVLTRTVAAVMTKSIDRWKDCSYIFANCCMIWLLFVLWCVCVDQLLIAASSPSFGLDRHLSLAHPKNKHMHVFLVSLRHYYTMIDTRLIVTNIDRICIYTFSFSFFDNKSFLSIRCIRLCNNVLILQIDTSNLIDLSL